MLFGKKKTIALDIGSSSIKLAELDVSRKGTILQSFSVLPTPAGVISGGEISDAGILAEAIKTLVAQSKTKRKHCAVGVWGSAVIVKRITIPRMDEKVLADQIKFEAEQYIPFDISTINIDYHILKGKSPTPDTMNVLLIAAQKEFILKYAEAVELAGVQCSIVDVEGFALANCYKANYGGSVEEVVGLLNIGAATTNFVVVENGDVIFSRDILVGGQIYTADISKQMGISLEEAENLKISAATNQAAPQEVVDIISSTNEMIAEEIHRSFDFYTATVSDTPIQRVFATGGTSHVPHLTSLIGKTVGLGVQSFNPFQLITVNDRAINPTFMRQIQSISSIALGLGMRATGD